jgi:hypothetical protein
MKNIFKIILIFITSLILGCSTQASQNKAVLSKEEKHYCDSLKIDSSLLVELRPFTLSSFEPFHYSLAKKVNADGTWEEVDPIHLQGLVFNEVTAKTEIILNSLHKNFLDKGYSIFCLERNFGISGKPDVMGILKTTDQFEVLKQVRTDAANYDIDTDSLIKIMRVFDKKYLLDLIGASGDWCEFIINKEPNDWLVFAKEAYKACPDIVDQGSGTVEALADEMKKTKRLYFWWD